MKKIYKVTWCSGTRYLGVLLCRKRACRRIG
jgi:hypothetical protein